MAGSFRLALTVSLVEEARGGPFVYHGDFSHACREAERMGYDGIEIFAPSSEWFATHDVQNKVAGHGLRVAAIGSGAGWLTRKLSLSSSNDEIRKEAVAFVSGLIDAGAAIKAPVIIGSMQGRAENGEDVSAVRGRLVESLIPLAKRSADAGLPLLYEPLNRYETNLINRLSDGIHMLAGVTNVKLLADLFHMNIEEVDIAASIREAGAAVGHVHFADSNRRAVGAGHLFAAPIVEALYSIEYEGWLSAEVLPLPSESEAARLSVASHRRLFPA
ncbi:MAG: sugar phosphate isomerase/epimerase [Pirellulales bacterium]|jgi:sugar phosphate isomerase/epimerase|nr:sugar phosphate isomerase/epimerase [Pirellulales bacterium]TSA08056.1 MAG: sugar phosphate isomerase/epimerase [Planctomycetaceae bacterium]